MNESLWTFFFEMANFLALAGLLGWLFFKPVRQALEDQRAKSQQLEAEAAHKLADAQRQQQEVDAQRQSLSKELESMRSRAREAAEAERQRMVQQAREQIERERAALKRESLNFARARMAQIAGAVAATTQQSVGRLLTQVAGRDLQQALIDTACDELRSMTSRRLAPVVVESAATLDESAQQQIRDALGDAADSAQFRVTPDLLGGLRICTGAGLVDASIRGLADFAATALSNELNSMDGEDTASER